MTSPTTTAATTHELEVPGALLAYDVRRSEGGAEPPLMLIGSPMAAAGFGTLAGYFPDRTVITYDPRGSERSRRTDGAATSTPEEHGDDLHRVIAAVGLGPVDLFATSGGAINAMALVARHPEDVRTLVAHEPPVAALLPDSEYALAACRDIAETYRRDGRGPAMAKFIAVVSHQGPITAEYLAAPSPDPAVFGLPTEDDGSRDDVLLGQNMLTSTSYEPDVDALRAASTRVLPAAGVESAGQLAHRGAEAVAERLGTPVVAFPGDHAGFLGGEYGQTGQPEAFAARLREVLADRGKGAGVRTGATGDGRSRGATGARAAATTARLAVEVDPPRATGATARAELTPVATSVDDLTRRRTTASPPSGGVCPPDAPVTGPMI